MPQIFHRSLNSVGKILLIGVPLMFAGTALGLGCLLPLRLCHGHERSHRTTCPVQP